MNYSTKSITRDFIYMSELASFSDYTYTIYLTTRVLNKLTSEVFEPNQTKPTRVFIQDRE